MTDPNGMSCRDFDDVAAELSLGVLTGRERAEAVAHLDECDSCREHVRQLSLTGEEMLGLLPSREPTEGFESRVMERLGITTSPAQAATGPAVAASGPGNGDGDGATLPAGNPRKPAKRPNWTRRMLTTAAVALAVVACGVGGWGLRGATGPGSGGSTAEGSLREATLLSVTHHQKAGQIYLYDGNPRWLYMGLADPSDGDGTVVCQLIAKGGKVITIGSFKINGGYGAWGSPDPVAAADVTGARITSLSGKVLATASFTSS